MVLFTFFIVNLSDRLSVRELLLTPIVVSVVSVCPCACCVTLWLYQVVCSSCSVSTVLRSGLDEELSFSNSCLAGI